MNWNLGEQVPKTNGSSRQTLSSHLVQISDNTSNIHIIQTAISHELNKFRHTVAWLHERTRQSISGHGRESAHIWSFCAWKRFISSIWSTSAVNQLHTGSLLRCAESIYSLKILFCVEIKDEEFSTNGQLLKQSSYFNCEKFSIYFTETDVIIFTEVNCQIWGF